MPLIALAIVGAVALIWKASQSATVVTPSVSTTQTPPPPTTNTTTTKQTIVGQVTTKDNQTLVVDYEAIAKIFRRWKRAKIDADNNDTLYKKYYILPGYVDEEKRYKKEIQYHKGIASDCVSVSQNNPLIVGDKTLREEMFDLIEEYLEDYEDLDDEDMTNVSVAQFKRSADRATVYLTENPPKTLLENIQSVGSSVAGLVAVALSTYNNVSAANSANGSGTQKAG